MLPGRCVAELPMHIIKPHRLALGCGLAVALALGVLVISLMLGRGLWLAEPAYWQRQQAWQAQTPAAQLRHHADRFEARILNEVSTDTQATRTITLELDAINAWIDQKLDRWLIHQGHQRPPQITNIIMTTAGKYIVVAIQIHNDKIEQIFSLFFHISITNTERALIKLDSIRSGRLPIPTLVTANLIRGWLPTETAAMLLDGWTIEPILQIDPTRHLRLLDLVVYPDRIALKVVTEPHTPEAGRN